MRISDWSSDVCSSDLRFAARFAGRHQYAADDGLAALDRGVHVGQIGLPFAIARDGGDFFPVADQHRQRRQRRAEFVRGARSEQTHAHNMIRSEEQTSELQSLMRISYAALCLKKQKTKRGVTLQHIYAQ